MLKLTSTLVCLICCVSTCVNAQNKSPKRVKLKDQIALLTSHYNTCQLENEAQKNRLQALESTLLQPSESQGNTSSSTTSTSSKSTQNSSVVTNEVAVEGTSYAIQFCIKKESSEINRINNIRFIGYNPNQQNYIYQVDNLATYQQAVDLLRSIRVSNPMSAAFITKIVAGAPNEYFAFNEQKVDPTTLLSTPASLSKSNVSVNKNETDKPLSPNWTYVKSEDGKEKIYVNVQGNNTNRVTTNTSGNNTSTPSNTSTNSSTQAPKMESNWTYIKDENGQLKIVVNPQ